MSRKIGITFSPPDTALGMFSNGIRQNVLFFNELLNNIGYDVDLIIPEKSITIINSLYGFDSGKYKYSKLSDILSKKYDLIVQFGLELSEEVLIKLKNKGTKLVSYHCGNDYIYDMENALHGDTLRQPQYSKLKHSIFNQIWSIPQMTNTNQYYWQTLYKTECVEVPFIWSPLAIENYEEDCVKNNLGDLKYKTKEKNNIAIFEPNVNVFKWALPALLVCENSYNLENNIDHIYITNIQNNKKFNIKFFNDLIKSLDLYKQKKISVESRYNSLIFMSKYANIAVSHQWENPLNYLYLDLAWMGWPIIHNAYLCKDVGYFYEEFNYKMGGEILNDVIRNHDSNHKEYLEKNRKIINRYLPTNIILQEKYKELIENLF